MTACAVAVIPRSARNAPNTRIRRIGRRDCGSEPNTLGGLVVVGGRMAAAYACAREGPTGRKFRPTSTSQVREGTVARSPCPVIPALARRVSAFEDTHAPCRRPAAHFQL